MQNADKQISQTLFFLLEPNNESPLNPQAAKLWNDQTKYKKHLTEEYHRTLNRDQQDS